MPTYDYRCQKCDHTWELFQPITAEPVRKCPECGKTSAKRVIGPGAAVIFRGSGFYQTDYRTDSYKKGAAADKKATDGSTSGSESKAASESKTEKKSTSGSE